MSTGGDVCHVFVCVRRLLVQAQDVVLVDPAVVFVEGKCRGVLYGSRCRCVRVCVYARERKRVRALQARQRRPVHAVVRACM